MTRSEKSLNPRVSYILLAFNQVSFIRESVQAAFNQDYDGLQIVLSDDGSSDGTYEAICEMAANYSGRHSLLVRQSGAARGTLPHFLGAVRAVPADFYIVSAGDDVSLPNRSSELVRSWIENDFWAVCSNYDVIDYDGNVLVENYDVSRTWSSLLEYLPAEANTGLQLLHGASASYDRRVFSLLDGTCVDGVLWEDMVLNLALVLAGRKVGIVRFPLVRYRRHAAALINNAALSSSRRSEEAEAAFFRLEASRAKAYDCMLELSDRFDHPAVRLDREALARARDASKAVGEWSRGSLFQRVSRLLRPRSREDLKWMLLRMWGRSPNYFPRRMVGRK